MIREDCKFLDECGRRFCDGKRGSCIDYEQDPQIARDNDTAKIASSTGYPESSGVENVAYSKDEFQGHNHYGMETSAPISKAPDIQRENNKLYAVIDIQHEEINKLKYDNGIMHEFILRYEKKDMIGGSYG